MADGDARSSRRTGEPKTTKDDDIQAATVSAGETAERASEIARTVTSQIADADKAMAVRDMAAIGQGAGESDITPELDAGALAFGTLVNKVGLGVATAQKALDETLVATALALSGASIKTVAVFEQVIDDETGKMDKGIVHLEELPLTNFVMPTAYMWSRVYLEADMKVEEFNNRYGIQVQQKSASAQARVGWGLGGFGASARGSYSSSDVGVDQSYSQDTAAGTLHMEATLEPRRDIELPRPFVVQKGPQLDLLVGPRREEFGEAPAETEENPNPQKPLIAHEVTVTAKLRTSSGEPNKSKALSVKVDNPTLSYTVGSGDGPAKTDDSGELQIVIRRAGSPFKPEDVAETMVRVAFGMVTSAAGVAL